MSLTLSIDLEKLSNKQLLELIQKSSNIVNTRWNASVSASANTSERPLPKISTIKRSTKARAHGRNGRHRNRRRRFGACNPAVPQNATQKKFGLYKCDDSSSGIDIFEDNSSKDVSSDTSSESSKDIPNDVSLVDMELDTAIRYCKNKNPTKRNTKCNTKRNTKRNTRRATRPSPHEALDKDLNDYFSKEQKRANCYDKYR